MQISEKKEPFHATFQKPASPRVPTYLETAKSVEKLGTKLQEQSGTTLSRRSSGCQWNGKWKNIASRRNCRVTVAFRGGSLAGACAVRGNLLKTSLVRVQGGRLATVRADARRADNSCPSAFAGMRRTTHAGAIPTPKERVNIRAV